jgi:hypothetical protein
MSEIKDVTELIREKYGEKKERARHKRIAGEGNGEGA